MINIHEILPGIKPFVLGWIEDAAASASSIRLGSYVRTNEADLITARHTFDPPAGNSPFILSANGQGQLVTGLNADLLDGLHASDLSSSGHGHGTGSANTLADWSSSSLLGYIANGSGFLKNDGAGAFTWESTPAAGHNLLSSTHSDSLTASVVRGDVLYGNSTPAWARLAHPGAASHFLISSATDVAWSTYTLALGGNLTTQAAGAAALMSYANTGYFRVSSYMQATDYIQTLNYLEASCSPILGKIRVEHNGAMGNYILSLRPPATLTGNRAIVFPNASLNFEPISTGWSVTGGYTADKAFDPESTTQLEIGRVLGTLIDALKTYGLLGA